MTSQTSQVLDPPAPADEDWYGPDDPTETGPGPEPPPSQDAPHGWMLDAGHWRPKKAPGRPRKPPAADELAARPPLGDVPDAPPKPTEGKRSAAAEVPMPKSGLIATGVDRLYRRAGKTLALLDPDMGVAMIECATPDPADPDAPTTGQAWEALAKTNARIRAWLLNLIKGGAWQDLIMAHLPIGLALMTKSWVQKFLTFGRAAELLEPDDDGGEGAEPGGLRPADAQEMHDMAQEQARRMAAKMGAKLPPGVAEAALAEAERRTAAGQAPPGLRHQPQRGTRAKRRGSR